MTPEEINQLAEAIKGLASPLWGIWTALLVTMVVLIVKR